MIAACVVSMVCCQAQAVSVVAEPTTLDVGTITVGQQRSMTVVLRNIGTTPAVIVTAAGNCACTTSTWPSDPIAPGGGAEATITVKPTPSQAGGRLAKKVSFVVQGQGVVDVGIVGAVVGAGTAEPAPSFPTAHAPLPPHPSTTFARVDPPMTPGARVAFPTLDHWIVGTPETDYAPGVVYVLDFFGTDCSHCREYAVLIEGLMREYGAKGVRFIATTDEPEGVVREWYAKPGVPDHFPCAVTSDPDRSAMQTFQFGTFRAATPRFFIMKDGAVLWFGHPKVARAPLDAILAGTWDPATERGDAVVESNTARAKNAIDGMVKWCDRSGDWAPLLELFDNIRIQLPERDGPFASQKFLIMIGLAKQTEAGYALGHEIAKSHANEMEVIRSMARAILETPFVKQRDLSFAMELAVAADALAAGNDARAADTLAMAHYAQGHRADAIANGERAVALETEQPQRRKYEHALQKYRTGPMGPEPSKDHSPAPAGAAPNASAGDSTRRNASGP